MNVYFNAVTRTVSIDRGNRIIEVPLPTELDATEIAYVMASDTMRTIIEQLTKRGD